MLGFSFLVANRHTHMKHIRLLVPLLVPVQALLPILGSVPVQALLPSLWRGVPSRPVSVYTSDVCVLHEPGRPSLAGYTHPEQPARLKRLLTAVRTRWVKEFGSSLRLLEPEATCTACSSPAHAHAHIHHIQHDNNKHVHVHEHVDMG